MADTVCVMDNFSRLHQAEKSEDERRSVTCDVGSRCGVTVFFKKAGAPNYPVIRFTTVWSRLSPVTMDLEFAW